MFRIHESSHRKPGALLVKPLKTDIQITYKFRNYVSINYSSGVVLTTNSRWRLWLLSWMPYFKSSIDNTMDTF